VQQEMEQEIAAGRRPVVVPDGNPNSGWMVLDYGSIMVHIMTAKSRLFYNVEGQWRSKGGKDFRPDLMELWTKVEFARPPSDNDKTTTTTSPEDDPFWS
jgi:Ribosomal silencing factor during starvation